MFGDGGRDARRWSQTAGVVCVTWGWTALAFAQAPAQAPELGPVEAVAVESGPVGSDPGGTRSPVDAAETEARQAGVVDRQGAALQLAEPTELRLHNELVPRDRQVIDALASAPDPIKKELPWYEKLNLRGYTQFRYNRLPSFDMNDDLVNAQGDRSIGGGNGFSIRRARLILFGDVHERISIYLQPDFVSSIGDQLHVMILRDWYTDIYLNESKTLRVRVGQSKVPYGFENMQSSQNRLAFDRNDALNSAVKDERDLGVFVYWAPDRVRKLFRYLVENNLKGSGDYGVLGLGVYNGQTANQPARVDATHVVGRVAYPFQLGSQIIEFNVGGYYGKYLSPLVDREGVTPTVASEDGLLVDARAYGALVIYPRPLGLVVEATVGRGPQQGRDDPLALDSRPLRGGYAQLMYKIDGFLGSVSLIPYTRATFYEGGKKFEANAPRYEIRELEFGLEWQIVKSLELTAAYMISDRTSSRFPHNQEQGHVTRVQLQVNY